MKKSKWKSFDFGEEKQSKVITKGQNGLQDSTSNSVFNFLKKLEPKDISDLAVHPKKIEAVKIWLQLNVLQSHTKPYNPMLILSGPTGSGKTATLRALCRSLNIQISEWLNPTDQDYEFTKSAGQVAKLVEFLSESKYSSIFESFGKKVALIEDFPNFAIHNPSEFVGVLENCYSSANTPIVFICTDANNSSLNLIQTLFPQDVREKFSIDLINFNPCATNLLKTALKRAHTLIQANLNTCKIPSANVVDAIVSSAMGDIRCALNQYHFATLKGTTDLPIEIKQEQTNSSSAKRKRGSTKISTIKCMAKDESLGIFHCLGRVLNPKRKQHNNSWRVDCQLDQLIDELSTQPNSIASLLFENYLKYFGDFGDLCKASDIMSVTQILFEKWTEKQEVLVLGLWIVVFGLMVSNEHKVSKWNQITGSRRIKKSLDHDLQTRQLSPMDYSYYNIISSSDMFHKFNHESI